MWTLCKFMYKVHVAKISKLTLLVCKSLLDFMENLPTMDWFLISAQAYDFSFVKLMLRFQVWFQWFRPRYMRFYWVSDPSPTSGFAHDFNCHINKGWGYLAGNRLYYRSWHAAGFLKSLLSTKSVCVSVPEAINNYSGVIQCDMEPLWLVKQVVGVSLSFIWQLKSWQII